MGQVYVRGGSRPKTPVYCTPLGHRAAIMAPMNSSNPYLRDKAVRQAGELTTTGGHMTIEGTLTKISLLLLVVVVCAAFTWNQVGSAITTGGGASIGGWMIGGSIGALALSLIISFKPNLAPVLAVPFAVCEGLLLGAVSAMAESSSKGIVFQAVLLTVGVALSMFMVWRSGLVKVTDRFRSIACGAMGAIFLVYLLSFALSFAGIQIPFIHSSGPLGIGFSVVVLVFVSMMLMVDFDLIQRMSQQNVPKAMEWYGAFALLVTLVWLYWEMLRLLSKLRD